MKKYLLSSVVASLVLASNSMGIVTISLTGNPTTGPAFFLGPGLGVVPDGALIRIGTFEAPPNPSGTFLDFAAGFHEFARTTMGNTTNTNTGHPVKNNIAGSADPVQSPDADSYFIGKNVYIWVYADADGDTTGTQGQGVFSTTLTYADQATALSTSTTGYINDFGTLVGAPAGSTPANATVTAGLVTRFDLAAPPIPEPSSVATLGLLGLLGLARRRR